RRRFEARCRGERCRGVLDTLLEPVIGLAEGETRWRGMTIIVYFADSFSVAFLLAAPFPSFSSAFLTCSNSCSEALSARGKRRLRDSSALTIAEPITTRANHLWSAGTTCPGGI